MTGMRNLGLTIGIVLDREDPEHLGRVRMTLPEYQDRETGWSRIAFPFAGKTEAGKHGAFNLPEVGDEVLVGFRQDSRDVVVLGYLYSDERTPPVEPYDERVFYTKAMNKVTISDVGGEERIAIETKENKIVLNAAEKKVEITSGTQSLIIDHNAGEITIKAPKVVVEAPTIQLKGNVDVTS